MLEILQIIVVMFLYVEELIIINMGVGIAIVFSNLIVKQFLVKIQQNLILADVLGL